MLWGGKGECIADIGWMQIPLLVQDDDVIVGSSLPPEWSFQEVKTAALSRRGRTILFCVYSYS